MGTRFDAKIDVKDSVYQDLRVESVKQNKPVNELIDLALIKYLETAFLIKPPKKPRRPRIYNKTNWLNKR
ncbi:MAG: hypothetical protein ACRC2J_13710, partial [Microcoleaceae cyanobacterium]